uniref:Uncharacterized protein n=1 Tax=Arundo donax TaxID=35708 RepID=A0A0A8Z423_ARUDO
MDFCICTPFNTLVVWELWNIDVTVFNGTTPSVELILQNVVHEGSICCLAGARDLVGLLALSVVQGT